MEKRSHKTAPEVLLQLARYGVAGVGTNLVAYILFLLLSASGIDHKLAMSMVYVAAASAGFFANRKWVFSSGSGLLGTGIRYSIAHVSGYLLNLSILWLFVDQLKYPYQYIQAAAIFVVAGFLFCVFRIFVFPAGNKLINRRAYDDSI